MTQRLYSSPPTNSVYKRTVAIGGAPEAVPAGDAACADIAAHAYATLELYGAHADTTSVTVEVYVQDDYGDSEAPRLFDAFTITSFAQPTRVGYALPDYEGVAARISAMSDTGSGNGSIAVRLKRTNHRPE